jgi:hypothetical protein
MPTAIRQRDFLPMQLVALQYPIGEDVFVVERLGSASSPANEAARTLADVFCESLGAEEQNFAVRADDAAIFGSGNGRTHLNLPSSNLAAHVHASPKIGLGIRE